MTIQALRTELRRRELRLDGVQMKHTLIRVQLPNFRIYQAVFDLEMPLQKVIQELASILPENDLSATASLHLTALDDAQPLPPEKTIREMKFYAGVYLYVRCD